MSDSDSQSNQSFNMGQIPEQQQYQVKQILQKGKKILPTYDESSLYSLFKRYYSVEHIFFNELNIIAKRIRGDFDQDNKTQQQADWVTVGRKVRTKVNKSKYNFLEDKQLIRRAERYLKDKSIIPEKGLRENARNQPKRNYKENASPEKGQQRKNQPQRNKYEQRKQKLKFVEKVEQIKNETAPQNIEAVKPQRQIIKTVDNQSKNKYVPKQQQPLTPVIENKVQQIDSTNVKKVETQVVKKQQTSAKKVEQTEKPVQSVKSQKAQVPKQDSTKVQPAKTSVSKQVSAPISTIPKPQNSTQSVTTSSNAKIIIDQTYDPQVAAKNFEQATKQNSFVLSFIRPQNYPQRVSYVRTATGEIKNVQIRIAGTASN